MMHAAATWSNPFTPRWCVATKTYRVSVGVGMIGSRVLKLCPLGSVLLNQHG